MTRHWPEDGSRRRGAYTGGSVSPAVNVAAKAFGPVKRRRQIELLILNGARLRFPNGPPMPLWVSPPAACVDHRPKALPDSDLRSLPDAIGTIEKWPMEGSSSAHHTGRETIVAVLRCCLGSRFRADACGSLARSRDRRRQSTRRWRNRSLLGPTPTIGYWHLRAFRLAARNEWFCDGRLLRTETVKGDPLAAGIV